MSERILAFDDGQRADRWHGSGDAADEIMMDEPGNAPGFFDEKNNTAAYDDLNSLNWYRRSLGEVPTFTAEQEIDLAKKVEAGKFAGQLLELCNKSSSRREREETTELLRALYEADQLPVAMYDELYRAPHESAEETFESMLQRLVGTSRQHHKRRELEHAVRAGTQARNQLIHSVLPLVVSIVRNDYWGDLPLSDMELVACGNIGAVRAVEGFDYTRGARLGATAAKFWIHKEIKAGIVEAKRQRQLRGTTEEQLRADKIDQARKALEDDGSPSTDCTARALARLTGIKEEWAWDALDSSRAPASVELLLESATEDIIDKKAFGTDEQALQRLAPDDASAFVAAEQRKAAIEELLAPLSSDERDAVRKACGFEGNYEWLTDIAQELGVHKNTLNSRYHRGLRKLQSHKPEFLQNIAQRLCVPIVTEVPTAATEWRE